MFIWGLHADCMCIVELLIKYCFGKLGHSDTVLYRSPEKSEWFIFCQSPTYMCVWMLWLNALTCVCWESVLKLKINKILTLSNFTINMSHLLPITSAHEDSWLNTVLVTPKHWPLTFTLNLKLIVLVTTKEQRDIWC